MSKQENEKTFKLKGVDCPDCAQHVESAVSKIPGVTKVELNFATSKLKVTTNDADFNFNRVVLKIEGLGYSVEDKDEISNKTTILKVKEMDCPDEEKIIQNKLKDQKGIIDLDINVIAQQVKIVHNPELLSTEDLIKLIAQTGMTASLVNGDVNAKGAQLSVILKVEAMDCSDEAEVIEKKLKAQKGIIDFDINVVAQQVKISYDPAFLSVQDLIKIIAETGMKASLVNGKVSSKGERHWWTKNRQVILLIASGILTVAGVIVGLLDQTLISEFFYGAAIVAAGFYPAKMGILALKTKTINIRLLMVVGAVGAVILGFWEEAALLVVIYSLGDVMEAYSVDKARGALRALMQLSPKEALVRRNGKEVTLPTEEIGIDDTVIVRPGERIPLDGIVVGGDSFVDQAAITGESIPLRKQAGDEAFAGTVNQKGSLDIKVTKIASDTTLAKIIHSVEEAQAKKTSYQRFAEKFGKYYTPIMFVVAIAVSIIPPLFVGNWTAFIYRGLVVLVVSCSCGLALSVPVAVVSAMANGARKGVLFKGGVYLEVAQHVKAIAFDKTGTLTIGRPAVTDIIVEGNFSEHKVLAIAGTVESKSEHPIAEAIVRKAKESNVPLDTEVEDFTAIVGMGVKAKIDGHSYFMGNTRLLKENSIAYNPTQDQTISMLENDGKTVVLLSDETKLLGIFAVADIVKADAKEAVQTLKRLGVKTVMLTGDNKRTAQAIASQVGIDEYLAELLPENKVEAVKGLKQKYGVVAMVGDGINDAPAMAVSDLGIAMGAAGTDIAIETGDVVLLADDLTRIPYVLKLSRRAMNNVRQNTVASLGIVAFLIPTALLGFIGLVPGLILNEFGALIIIANALRLLRAK